MNDQIKQLKRENQDLKDLLQDVHLMVIGKDVRNFGLMEQEIAAKVKSVAGGGRYIAADFDMSDKNGDQ